MKFQPDTLAGVNLIARHDAGPPARVWVGGAAWSGSVLVPWSGAVLPWPVERFEALAAPHFERLVEYAPEVLIFGSGARLRFVAPALLRALIERRIGVETMDTAAACRTYNVLASEKRRVLAALLLEAG
jgi:uncharacterized protein